MKKFTFRSSVAENVFEIFEKSIYTLGLAKRTVCGVDVYSIVMYVCNNNKKGKNEENNRKREQSNNKIKKNVCERLNLISLMGFS